MRAKLLFVPCFICSEWKTIMVLNLDADDARDINAAIAHYQRTRRWPEGGTSLPEGESDMAGAIIGEICRDWLEAKGALASNF